MDNELKDHRNCAYVEEQWIEREGIVYRRMRWDGEDWSPFEVVPEPFPWVVVKRG